MVSLGKNGLGLGL